MWRASNNLAAVTTALGDHERSRQLLHEALVLARAMKDPWPIAQGLRQLGEMAFLDGDLDRASSLFEESLTWWRRAGATRGLHWSLAALGRIALARADLPRAESCFRESLLLSRDAGDRLGSAQCLIGLASLTTVHRQHASVGEARRAARLLGATEALCAAGTIRLTPDEQSAYDRAAAFARAQLDNPAFVAAWDEGQAMTLKQAVAHALEEPAPT